MKRIIAFMMCYFLMFSLVGCGTNTTDTMTEEMPVDYGDAVTVAQNEFNRTFSEFINLQIKEISTMARTTSAERVVIQFRYSSDFGDGLYGFEIEKTAIGAYDIIQQGEDVTIDNLVKEQ